MTLELKVRQLPHGEGLPLPAYASAGAAGLDLRAAIDEAFELKPGQRSAVPTGLALQLPEDHEGQVRPRSGLAVRHGITVANAPGTIDADYRGELHVALINLGEMPFVIERGMRIAQLVVAPVQRVSVTVVDTLDETSRGDGGFGSTGLS